MRSIVKKIFLGVIAVFGILLLVAAIFFYPYYRMPAESKEMLNARLLIYQAAAKEMSDRPKDARNALERLITDLMPVIAKEDENLAGKDCPSYDLQHIKTLEPIIREFQPFDTRFQAIVKDRLVLQQDADLEANVLHFLEPRRFVEWELAAAILDIEQGRRNEAMQRLASVIRFNEGLIRTPQLIYLMMCIAIEMKIDGAVMFLLPRLSTPEIDQLKDMLEKLPDTRAMYIKAMQVEVASYIQLFDRLRSNQVSVDDLNNMLYWKGVSTKILLRLATLSGYMTRERYMCLSLASRDIEALQKWLADGANGSFQSPIRKEIKYSLFFTMAWPNVADLLKNTVEDMQHREAVLTAMQLELQRRQAGDKTNIELPYDEFSRLVLKPEYGCIVKNKNIATDAGSAKKR